MVGGKINFMVKEEIIFYPKHVSSYTHIQYKWLKYIKDILWNERCESLLLNLSVYFTFQYYSHKNDKLYTTQVKNR